MGWKVNYKKGFSLVELVIYVAILSIVVSVVAVFLPQVIRNNLYIQSRAQVLDNAHAVIETLSKEIRTAKSLYEPTSVFDSNPGQLSLETSYNTISTENSTFVDFYVDGERLYIKREEQDPELLVSEDIKVVGLTFTKLNSNSQYPSVRIVLTLTKDGSAVIQEQTEVTLTSTVSFRSY